MKNIKFKKTLILFVISLILISSFSVFCSAESTGIFKPGDFYTFNSTIYPVDVYIDPIYFSCTVDGIVYNFDSLVCENTTYGAEIRYIDNNLGEEITVYSDGSWLNDGYRTLHFTDLFVPSDQETEVLFSINGADGTYVDGDLALSDRLLDILHKLLYRGRPLFYEESIGLSLVAQVCSLLVFLAPFLITSFIFIFILKRL